MNPMNILVVYIAQLTEHSNLMTKNYGFSFGFGQGLFIVIAYNIRLLIPPKFSYGFIVFL